MSEVQIVKVSNKRQLEEFIQFHYDLYRGNEYDVPNLHSDEINTLSKDKNPAFDFCKAQYFLAYKDGKVAGFFIVVVYCKKLILHPVIIVGTKRSSIIRYLSRKS